MKKIYSFALAAVAVLSAASCQQELANETLENFENGKFTVTAVATETKTALAEDGLGVVWTPNDSISVFDDEGVAVKFTTDITSNAPKAKFTTEKDFYAPEGDLLAVYPHRINPETGMSVQFFDTEDPDNPMITNFRIAGTQTAVAGSFDPEFASAVGFETEDGVLAFKSLNSLIKFTIGGEKAPSEVALTNGGLRNICGLFNYDIKTGGIIPQGGEKTITLKPAKNEEFEVGKTYYISFMPGGNLSNVSLTFDKKEVKRIAGDHFANEENGFYIGKVFDFGTLSLPESLEENVVSAIDVTRVWGHYGESGAAWSNSLVSSLDNNDRSLAMDEEYIYIPETNTSANIHKFKISDGTYVGTLPKSTDMNLGTHYVSCARTVKNADGDYILLVSNLSLNATEGLRIFAYVNGTDNEPVTLTTISSGRRFGDKFTVTGTWENGKMWFRSYDDRGMVGYVPLTGAYPIKSGDKEWNWIEAHAIDGGTAIDASNISEVTWVPGTTGFCLLNTNSSEGAKIMQGTESANYTMVKTYSALAKTFGYNFFEVGENKFVAWVSIIDGKDKPRLQIVQSDATSLEGMTATFDNLDTRLVYEAPLQNADNFDEAGSAGGHTVADCCVTEINGEIYIAAMAQKAGLSLFKVSAKQ